MKYTIKSLTRLANESESADWFDMLYYWMVNGNQDMMYVFNHMSKKETLQVINRCHEELMIEENEIVSSIYKCALTSLVERI